MSLKQNLLKKRSIDQLTQSIRNSIGPVDSNKKLDREGVRALLSIAGYRLHHERDLDIYVPVSSSGNNDILVLDNDLPFYRTTISDIVLRKSPTIKEMISIKNAIRILNDSDVVVSKKVESIKRLQQECIGTLDLRITESGLDEIARDGIDSLRNKYGEGVQEAIELFSELLKYQPAPKPFVLVHHIIAGDVVQKSGNETVLGPVIIYSLMQNHLSMSHRLFSSHVPDDIEKFQSMVTSPTDDVTTGQAVFDMLKSMVLSRQILQEGVS